MNTFPITIEGRKAIADYLASRPMMASLHAADMSELPSGDGYSAGGVPLSNPRTGIGTDESGNQYAWLTWDNPSWSDAGFSGARYLQISDVATSLRDVPDASHRDAATAFGLIDFGADKAGQGAEFTYKFPAAGGVIRI